MEEWTAVEDFQETFVAEDDQEDYCSIYAHIVRGIDWPRTYRFRGARRDGSTFDADATVAPLTYKGRTFASGTATTVACCSIQLHRSHTRGRTFAYHFVRLVL